ncbi:unknown protein [Synechocystis sp. LKSZ1]
MGLWFLGLSLAWGVPSQAQLPGLSSDVQSLLWNINRNQSGQIGNLNYDSVRLDGVPLFLVALPASTMAPAKKDEFQPIRSRVKRIENKLQEVLKRGFDPQSLRVYPSVLNGQTVILAADDKTLQPRILGTVTEADAELHAQSVEDLANQAAEITRQALIKAQAERQPQALWDSALLALRILALITVISCVISWIYQWLGHRVQVLKTLLSQAKVVADDESIVPSTFSPQLTNQSFLLKLGDRLALAIYFFLIRLRGRFLSTNLQGKTDNIFGLDQLLYPDHQAIRFEELKTLTTQRIRILIFLRRLLLLLQSFVWLRGSATLLLLFPYSRPWGAQLAGVPLTLVLIWLSILILAKVTELLIDKSLLAWGEDLKLLQASKNSRQALRLPTIASALKGVSSFFYVSVGVILSLTVFEIPITPILTGAGIIGFAISFGSQNLIKDLIAGLTALINDSYATGDYVILGLHEGLIEDMNLFVTRLRSANGDLITIPNGAITTVCNQTKDWSRVDYSIQVSYDADIKQALNLLKEIADQLYHDPQWHPVILDQPDLKGIENISHQGITLRIWLKTKPGAQWDVGRELRLRIKVAFEQEGIAIGIPKQAFLLQNADNDPFSPPDP